MLSTAAHLGKSKAIRWTFTLHGLDYEVQRMQRLIHDSRNTLLSSFSDKLHEPRDFQTVRHDTICNVPIQPDDLASHELSMRYAALRPDRSTLSKCLVRWLQPVIHSSNKRLLHLAW